MKYYYPDPLAAAWMAKHFGMRFFNGTEPETTGACKFLHADVALLSPKHHIVHSDYKGNFYIHPDSLHLLKPVDGDLVENCGYVGIFSEDKECPTLSPSVEIEIKIDGEFPVTIDKRNNIPFHWPEVEDDN